MLHFNARFKRCVHERFKRQVQEGATAYALNSYFAIAYLDLLTWKALIQLDIELGKSGLAEHTELYNEAVNAYTGDVGTYQSTTYPGYSLFNSLTGEWQQWRSTYFSQRQGALTGSVCAYDSLTNKIVGCGDTYAEAVSNALYAEIAVYQKNSFYPLKAMVSPDKHPEYILQSGTVITLSINDGAQFLNGSLGRAYAFIDENNALAAKRVSLWPLGQNGQFRIDRIKKADDTGDTLYYGDAVTIASVSNPSLYISPGGGSGNPPVMANTQSPARWILVNPFEDCWSNFDVKIPVTVIGQFILQDPATNEYLGLNLPPAPDDINVPPTPDDLKKLTGSFTMTDAIEADVRYVFGNIPPTY